MKFHGVQIQEGSSISNLTVASGTAFPVTPNDAEVFFRTDSDIRVRGLYVYVSGTWDRIASADAITVPSAANFPSVANTGDLFYKDSNDVNEALYVWTGSTWSPAASGSGSTATVTGDVTGTLTVGGSGALTLATVVGAATIGSAANATVITYDAKGRITGSSTTPIAINATQVTAGSFSDARIAQSNVTQYQGALSLAASQTTSGTFADAQIAASSVTQHQASLTILETQITDGALLARNAGNETITGTWQFNNALPVGTPLSSSHATTKAYVDAAINGLSWKNSVVAATTANITLSGVQTLDGVAVTASQRVLVKNQSSQSQNGVYVVAAGAWIRAVDFDQVTPADEVNSAAVFVQQGTLQADTAWTQTAPVVTIGSDAMVFAQFATGGLIGGTGLTLTGNQLDVVGTAGRIVANADSIDLATVTNSSTGSFLKLTTDAYGRVTGTTAVVASDITSLVSYTAGTGISVTGTTIANTGVLSITGSTNLSASTSTGAVTLSLPTTLSGLTSVTSTTFVGALTGNASTASSAATLTTGRVISASGDATGSSSAFDGSAAVAIPLTLATVNAGPVAASFSKVTTNAKGLVTATTPVVVGDITGILSYTGDATSSGTTLTLATVNANVGQFAVPTVNAKGLVTSATNLSITGDAAGTSSGAGLVLTLSTVNASPIASSFVKITTTGKGLVTSTATVGNTDIVTALGYTPVNRAGDTLTGALNLGGFTASNAGAPSVGTDLTNKNYVDAAIAGLSWKTSVLVATTANITLSGTQTIDGVALVAGNRVLVKNQTTASANGIYVVAAGAWTRSVDSTSAAQIDGEAVYVLQGTTQADTGWTETATVSTVGTDSVTYVQFSGSGTYVAGTGISLTGNTFANTGVLSVTGSTNLSTSASAGNITLSLPTTLSGLTSVSSTTFVGALTGNATTATTLQTGRIISVTGDATGSAPAFNGSAAVAIPLTLATVNASPASASFVKVTTTGTGLVTATTPVVAADITSLVNATYVLKAGDTMTGQLLINASGAAASQIRLRRTSDTSQYTWMQLDRADGSRSLEVISNGTVAAYGIPASAVGFNAQGTTGLHFSTADALRMSIDGSGNVGISTAGARLSVGVGVGSGTGQIYAFKTGAVDVPIESSTSSTSTAFGTNSSASANVWGAPATSSYLGNQAAYPLVLTTNGVERMRIDTNGNVGIGGTPTNRLDVFHTVTGIGARVRNTGTGVELAIRTDAATAGIDAGNTTGGITFSINAVEKMRMDTTGNLGIGTTPTVKLEVRGNIASGGTVGILHNYSDTGGDARYAGLNFVVGSDNGTSAIRSYRTNSANNFETALVFMTNPSGATQTPVERMRIDSTGQVGIGGVPSVAYLDIFGNAGAYPIAQAMVRINNASTTGQSAIDFKHNGTFRGRVRSDYAGNMSYVAIGGVHDFYINGDSGTGTNAMRIDAAGNVGINTTATISGVKLNVAGGISSSGLNVAGNGGFYNAANKFGVDNNAGQTRMYSSGANSTTRGSYDFRITDSVGTLDASAMIIDSAGVVLVGTTTTSNPQSGILLSPGTGLNTNISIAHANTAPSGNFYIGFNYNSTNIGGIVQNGTTAVSYNTTSDRRLKTSIVDAPSAASKVLALQVRSFDWISDGTHVEHGFIAQELNEVEPLAVTPGETWAIDPSKLVATLAKALQESLNRTQSLEANVEGLLARIEALEAK